MRIEIDKELAKLLNTIKEKEPTIYGRGHAETVRFLANYYIKREPVQTLVYHVDTQTTKFLRTLDINIEQSLERVFPKALARAIANILTLPDSGKDGNQPQQRSATADQGADKGRLETSEAPAPEKILEDVETEDSHSTEEKE